MYDAIIVIILAISLVIGVKKGFIKTAFSMLSLLISSVLVYFLYDGFLSFFSSSAGGEMVSEFITENYEGLFAEQVSAVVVSAVSLVLLYFIIKLILKLLAGVLGLLSKLPVINTINIFLGGALGLVFGALLVVIITNIAAAIPSLSPYVETSAIVELTDILFVRVN